jgi:hypothetical protein
MKTVLLAAALCMTAGMATASTVNPVSYDMPNGSQGSFTYFDDSYSGSGNKAVPGAALWGGLGDLTDGVIATQNWNVTPGAYVGWQSDPIITFHFDQVYAFSAITLHFDDSNGLGSVFQPTSVSVNGVGYTVPDNPGAAPFAFTADLAGLQADSLTVQIFRTPGLSWVFLSEVSFDGDVPTSAAVAAVPLPAGGILLIGALGMLGFTRRRSG